MIITATIITLLWILYDYITIEMFNSPINHTLVTVCRIISHLGVMLTLSFSWLYLVIAVCVHVSLFDIGLNIVRGKSFDYLGNPENTNTAKWDKFWYDKKVFLLGIRIVAAIAAIILQIHLS